MAATIAQTPADVTRSTAIGARGRAQARSSWATRAVPSRVLAGHYGVSASRARHLRSDDATGPLTVTLALIADPNVDAGPIVAAVLAAYEERHLYAPTDVLRARLAHLRDDDEHRLEAAQNRATVVHAPNRADAYRDHAAALIEMATIEELLG